MSGDQENNTSRDDANSTGLDSNNDSDTQGKQHRVSSGDAPVSADANDDRDVDEDTDGTGDACPEGTHGEAEEGIVNVDAIETFLQTYEAKCDDARTYAKDDRYLAASSILDDVEATFSRSTAQLDQILENGSGTQTHRDLMKELHTLRRQFTSAVDLIEIRQRSRKVCDFFREADRNDGWTVQKDDGNVRVSYKPHASDDIITIKTESTVKAGIVPLVAVMNEVDLYKSWMPSWRFPFRLGLHSATRLGQIHRAEQVCGVRGSCPWPFRDREAVFHAFGADCLDENASCVIMLRDVDTWPGIDIPDAPPDGDIVRCALEGGVILRYISPTVTHFRLIAHINPRMGLVPAWFINFFTRTCAHMIFNRYVDVALSIPGSAYAERIQGNEELFGHLRQRLLEFAASANALRVVSQTRPDPDNTNAADARNQPEVIDVDAARASRQEQ